MPPEDLRHQVAASMGTAISRGQAPLHRRSQQAPRRLTQNQKIGELYPSLKIALRRLKSKIAS